MARSEADLGRLRVTVVYALPDEQHLVPVLLPAGATVADAVSCSGLPQRFPVIGSGSLQCAVFNRVVSLAEPVVDGDRVEILRLLQVDPKEQRRREAARRRSAGRKRS